ncbi:MAG: hypothetical protein AB8E82_01945 [Aureispira sp.]
MYKSKAIAIFYQFSRAEKIAFRKFVHSPYHNSNKKVQALLEHLYPLDSYKDRPQLDRKIVHKAVFGKKSFSWPSLRHVASDLTLLLERFLVLEQEESIIKEQLQLAKIYQQKNLAYLAAQSFRKAEKALANYSYKDQQALDLTYLLEQNRQHQALEKDRAAANNIQALNSTFDQQYIAGKLKHACRIISYQRMYKQEYDLGLLPAVLEYLQQQPQQLEVPLIAIYYYYYQASTAPEGSTVYFQQFKQYLFEYQEVLEQEEVKDLYVLATNYSIKLLNKTPQQEQIIATFELYQKALHQGALLEQGRISPFAFTNIVAVALGAQKFEWTAQFLEAYSVYLPPKLQAAYVAYNYARWHFYQGQYQAAADLISAEDFEDVHLNLSAKILLLKVYYALDEIQLLEGLLNRFSTFLSRKKELAYHKKNYNNIIRFTRRLVALNPYSEKAKKKLRQEIEVAPLLTERTWLLEQLNQV